MSSVEHFKRQGTLLHGLIVSHGYSIYAFANKACYAKSGLYDIVSGKRSIMSLELATFVKIAKLLGYESLDQFAKDLALEILK